MDATQAVGRRRAWADQRSRVRRPVRGFRQGRAALARAYCGLVDSLGGAKFDAFITAWWDFRETRGGARYRARVAWLVAYSGSKGIHVRG